MTLLAYDRYQAIIRPLKYSAANKLRWIAFHIASAYAISFAMWLPPVILFMTTGSYNVDCYYAGHNPALFLFYASIAEVLPLLAMTFMYASCVQTLRRQFRKLHPVEIPIVRPIDSTDHVASPPAGFFERLSNHFRQHVESSHIKNPTSLPSGNYV
jgi:hypothetical protein